MCVRGLVLPVLVALRDIDPGEQLLRDYGADWWRGIQQVWEVAEFDDVNLDGILAANQRHQQQQQQQQQQLREEQGSARVGAQGDEEGRGTRQLHAATGQADGRMGREQGGSAAGGRGAAAAGGGGGAAGNDAAAAAAAAGVVPSVVKEEPTANGSVGPGAGKSAAAAAAAAAGQHRERDQRRQGEGRGSSIERGSKEPRMDSEGTAGKRQAHGGQGSTRGGSGAGPGAGEAGVKQEGTGARRRAGGSAWIPVGAEGLANGAGGGGKGLEQRQSGVRVKEEQGGAHGAVGHGVQVRAPRAPMTWRDLV